MPTLDNPKHEQFAQWIAAGKLQNEAYALTYGTQSQGGSVNASKLMRKPHIAARIAEMRQVITSKLPVLTLAEKRTFLKKVVTTPVGSIDENNPLTQSYKVRTRTDRDGATVEEKEYELPNKLKALELDAKLAGELQAGGAPAVRVSIYAHAGEIGAAEVIDVEAEPIEDAPHLP